MGHAHSDMHMSDEGKRMAHRFDNLEFDMLKQTYKDLARRREVRGAARNTSPQPELNPKEYRDGIAAASTADPSLPLPPSLYRP
mmetsp:Transcript_6318/g.17702  ORF Transcript_6318/g.17702 Transcript_6318/m.17702 type:complete len:84 (-) Transcript_6318:3053-3304(-)